MRMYSWSSRVAQDFGANQNIYATWLRSCRPCLLQSMCVQLPRDHYDNPWLTSNQEAFGRLCSSGRVEEYIEENVWPCLSPSRLVAELGAKMEDIAMVIVD